ncbi:Rv1355c family protein [Mycobacterium sp. 141]|uniref:Rv1355c family protein n=1 Tax=Mycobacterium sp. 141 TaxID=1120797 RepID=UPI00036983B8|nr:Rv1355c family protein [Mycobacterium sp. 141]
MIDSIDESTYNDESAYNAVIIDGDDPSGATMLAALRGDPRITTIDTCEQQRRALGELTPRPEPEFLDEPTRWAYYPWRRTVVAVLGPLGFRRLRFDRNRNLISADEQQRLSRQRIGVVGLSVGHAVAYNLAIEGVCGLLRLTDFDELELPNLNRVPATVFDLGLNKAVVAARRIAELDPYLPVEVELGGVNEDTIDEFLDGLDVVVEECDSLDAKVLVRHAAKARKLPVLMTTSDRGLLDVERFDLDPGRPLLHGLLIDVDAAALAGLSSKDKVPHVLGILDAGQLSPRMSASLIEVGKTVSTWPQRAGEVALGATVIADAVRRIGLDEPLPSGRVRVDVDAALDALVDPLSDPPAPAPSHPAPSAAPEPTDVLGLIATAANRAPSGGNVQPWHIESNTDGLTLRLATEYTTTMDVGYRGSAVALGAAAFNARVAAAAHGRATDLQWYRGDEGTPLYGTVAMSPGSDPHLAALYEPMLQRETNRAYGSVAALSPQVVTALKAAARNEGARLQILDSTDDIEAAAGILAQTDRIRYLTPKLHREMISELRWPDDPDQDTGLDVTTLGLAPGDLMVLEILRRPEVMARLAAWDAGSALGDETHKRVAGSAAVAVISVPGRRLTDYALGGSAVESVWVHAQQHGLAVQPVSPVFLYAHNDDDLAELSPAHVTALRGLQHAFRELTATEYDESQALVLRLSYAARPAVRSRRRPLTTHAVG